MIYDIITKFSKKRRIFLPQDPTWKLQKEGYLFCSQLPALRVNIGEWRYRDFRQSFQVHNLLNNSPRSKISTDNCNKDLSDDSFTLVKQKNVLKHKLEKEMF